jgi:hypothetical protein
MLSKEKQLNALEAYDLTGSFRSAAALVGCDHHTVKRLVVARDAGLVVGEPQVRERVTDPFIDKVTEWVERSEGRIRADRVHEKLAAMGYPGSERTTRRVVAAVKADLRRRAHRSYRPWTPEPGLWLQWDYGAGPQVAGVAAVLFCAWLAWSRFRVVIPLRDKTLPSVVAALDATFRLLGGAPTYALTDNEKTVTERHVARVPVRNPQIVSAGHYYGVTIATCLPADPESKGGSEATVRIAKADLVPTDTNLRDEFGSWAELEAACGAFMDRVNGRVHRMTGEAPAARLEREVAHLHRIPTTPFTAAMGETRQVSWSQTIAFRGARYSVPHAFCDQTVWVRVHGDELVVVAAPDTGAVEVARHQLLAAGQSAIVAEHYPPRPEGGPLERRPRPTSAAEAAFLALGEGARAWLVEAAAVGARHIDRRMADAVALARLWTPAQVDEALGTAATLGRFADGDLASILNANQTTEPRRASSTHSLQPGTRAWARHRGEGGRR